MLQSSKSRNKYKNLGITDANKHYDSGTKMLSNPEDMKSTMKLKSHLNVMQQNHKSIDRRLLLQPLSGQTKLQLTPIFKSPYLQQRSPNNSSLLPKDVMSHESRLIRVMGGSNLGSINSFRSQS